MADLKGLAKLFNDCGQVTLGAIIDGQAAYVELSDEEIDLVADALDAAAEAVDAAKSGAD
jgi:hypothetical protein